MINVLIRLPAVLQSADYEHWVWLLLLLPVLYLVFKMLEQMAVFQEIDKEVDGERASAPTTELVCPTGIDMA